jgi:hypothetical protein
MDDVPDFLCAQNGGKGLIPLGMDKLEGVPVPPEHVDEEKLDAAVAYPHSGGGPLRDVFPMEEVILKLLFGNPVGSLLVKFHQLADRARIAFLCAFAQTG